jgi:hypothetical protein
MTDPFVVALGSGLAWTATAVATHFAVLHLTAVQRRARMLVTVFVIATVGHALTALLLGCGVRAAYGGVLVFCAFILYGPFYYTISASISVRLLIELRRSGSGLTLDDIRRAYPVDEILAGRLRTLVASGYLRQEGEAFALTPKGALIARPFGAIKALWRLAPGG